VLVELTIYRYLIRMFQQLRRRWQVLRAQPEAGYSTEAVVVTALLVAMGVAAVAIIATKVLSSANGISTGGN
jgi:hypothetical protein